MKHNSKRYEKSILSDKYCSCVRQLLFDGMSILIASFSIFKHFFVIFLQFLLIQRNNAIPV